MNRTVLAALGILGGGLLAALLIWAAGPSANITLETTIPEKQAIAPRSNPKAQPANTRKSPIKEPIGVAANAIPSNKTRKLPAPQVANNASIENKNSRTVHITVQAHARWGQILGVLSGEVDPVSERLKERITDMRMEMVAARRDPESIDMVEMVERQRLILSELRQIPSWGPELEKTAGRVETLLNSIGEQ